MDDMLPEALPTKLPPPLKKGGRNRTTTHLGKKLPNANYAPENCPDPERAWRAASLLATGQSKKATCLSVGVSYNTLRRWERSDWWEEIYLDVIRTEHGDLKAAALTAAMALCETGDGATVRFLLERLDPQSFGPPKIQAEIRAENQMKIEAQVEGQVEVSRAVATVEQATEIASLLQTMGAFKHALPEEVS
mgnify:CR=1 FL=1|jgi:hypothetical protein